MANYNILLVEDDELDIISVRRSLKKMNASYRLHVAYNGKEALSILTSQEAPVLPDVILLDLNMPQMNGIELLSVLRKTGHLQDIPVFIMTTSAESADRVATEALGISGYVIKPLSYNDNTKRADAMDAFVHFHLRK